MWYNNSEIMAVFPPKESSFCVCLPSFRVPLQTHVSCG